MKIFGMEKLSLVDYDGKIATTLFTGNCNFKCGFCHNSPLVLDYTQLPEFDQAEIFNYLTKRKGVIEGVCVSGGEPTLHADLPDFLAKIKALGYPIKLDTNGTNPDMIKNLYKDGLVDYFAMDIKNNKQDYAKIIGFDTFDTSKIEKSVEFFLGGGAPYEFRTTLINEFHKRENIALIGEWIKGAKKYFLQKFKDSETCIKSHLSPVDDKTVLEFVDILSKNIDCVRLRGYDL